MGQFASLSHLFLLSNIASRGSGNTQERLVVQNPMVLDNVTHGEKLEDLFIAIMHCGKIPGYLKGSWTTLIPKTTRSREVNGYESVASNYVWHGYPEGFLRCVDPEVQ